jgi:hypothetical protein
MVVMVVMVVMVIPLLVMVATRQSAQLGRQLRAACFNLSGSERKLTGGTTLAIVFESNPDAAELCLQGYQQAAGMPGAGGAGHDRRVQSRHDCFPFWRFEGNREGCLTEPME